MKNLFHYLNPVDHLGDKKYSYLFPFITMILACVLSEVLVNIVFRNQGLLSIIAIFVFIGLIIYFAFREGLRGGFIAATITILYYFYIIFSHHFSRAQLTSGIETTITLAVLYAILAAVIGGLKETIDTFIEREADARRRLETIIQQLPVGVIITDSQGRVAQANKQADSILGLRVPIGFDFHNQSLIRTKQNGKVTPLLNGPLSQILTTGRAVVGREYEIERNGKPAFIRVSTSIIKNRSNKIIAAAEIIHDITAQKEIDKRKDDFVNMASHELKTPITSMKLYLDSLFLRIKKYDDERTTRIVSNIKNQTEKLQELVNDLLDVSRLQTGKLSFTKETFECNNLIEETIEGIQGAAQHKTIEFTKHSPLYVYADRFRIYQVLTNLLTNAIKYSPEGKPIKVQIKRSRGKIIVSVQDYGIGISQDQQKKIFDRLYQVTDDAEKTFPGFGMGLYISKEIIRRHRGSIWVESEKGKGSTFYFSLPPRKKTI